MLKPVAAHVGCRDRHACAAGIADLHHLSVGHARDNATEIDRRRRNIQRGRGRSSAEPLRGPGPYWNGFDVVGAVPDTLTLVVPPCEFVNKMMPLFVPAAIGVNRTVKGSCSPGVITTGVATPSAENPAAFTVIAGQRDIGGSSVRQRRLPVDRVPTLTFEKSAPPASPSVCPPLQSRAVRLTFGRGVGRIVAGNATLPLKVPVLSARRSDPEPHFWRRNR